MGFQFLFGLFIYKKMEKIVCKKSMENSLFPEHNTSY